MRAEALAELSQNPGLASQDINALRARVGMADFNGAAMTMDAFRTALLEERAVELYMEGHRFFDIVRQGRAATILSGDGFTSGTHEVFPIPEAEITLSGGLITQNNGY
jgi:hypothetical protein